MFRIHNMHGPTVYQGTEAEMHDIGRRIARGGPYRVVNEDTGETMAWYDADEYGNMREVPPQPTEYELYYPVELSLANWRVIVDLLRVAGMRTLVDEIREQTGEED